MRLARSLPAVLLACGGPAPMPAPAPIVQSTWSPAAWLPPPPKAPEVGPLVGPKPVPDMHTKDCMDRGFQRWDSLQGCLAQHPPSPMVYAASSAQPIVCPATLVTEWDFSPTGNDSDACTSAGNSCKTFAEWQRRLGCGTVAHDAYFPNGVDLFVHGDMPEYWSMTINLVPNPPGYAGYFEIQCDTTTVGSGSLAGVVPKNRSAGQALNAGLGASEPTFLGMQLSVPSRFGLGWVDSTVSGNTALLTQPVNLQTGAEQDGYANTDAFTVLRPSQINITRLSGKCATNECLGQWPNSGFQPRIVNCWRPSHSGVTDLMTLDEVRVDHSRIDVMVSGNSPTFHDSILTVAPGIGPVPILTPQFYSGSISSAGQPPNVGIQFSGENGIGSWIYADTIVHGTVGGGQPLSVETAYCDNLPGVGASLWIFPFPSVVYPTGANTPNIYGNCTIQTQFGGVFTYSGPAVGNFSAGVVAAPNVGLAWDYALSTPIPSLRTLTWAALDTSYASGGFSGYALAPNGQGAFIDWKATLPSVPAAPAAGTVLCNKTGVGYTWVTPANCN